MRGLGVSTGLLEALSRTLSEAADSVRSLTLIMVTERLRPARKLGTVRARAHTARRKNALRARDGVQAARPTRAVVARCRSQNLAVTLCARAGSQSACAFAIDTVRSARRASSDSTSSRHPAAATQNPSRSATTLIAPTPTSRAQLRTEKLPSRLARTVAARSQVIRMDQGGQEDGHSAGGQIGRAHV